MKILTFTAFLIGVALICKGQSNETTYYKNSAMDEEVAQEKAKYSRTIVTNADGSITTEIKNLKKDLIENRRTLKGEEPVGVWIYMTGRGPAEMDYDFTLEYSEQGCAKDSDIKNCFIDEAKYDAPQISTGEQFYEFVSKNIVYPAKAKRENIQGKVELILDMGKDGTINNIRVKKGVHPVIDKEAVRVLRKIKLSGPPKVNGQPQDLCGNVSIAFRLS